MAISMTKAELRSYWGRMNDSQKDIAEKKLGLSGRNADDFANHPDVINKFIRYRHWRPNWPPVGTVTVVPPTPTPIATTPPPDPDDDDDDDDDGDDEEEEKKPGWWSQVPTLWKLVFGVIGANGCAVILAPFLICFFVFFCRACLILMFGGVDPTGY